MVYNENGNIQNTEYLLDNLLNEAVYYVNVNLNDVTRTVVKLKGEITKYIISDGYVNGGKYINNFSNAVKELISNKKITVYEIKSILYGNYGEDNWFSVNPSEAEMNSINTDEIVDFAISVSELQKPLKQAYNDISKFNRNLDKEEKINIEVMKEINHYFTQAMQSIRNLSYACITVCMNFLKGKIKDNIELTTKNKYVDDTFVKDIKDKDINKLSEENQIKLIKYNIKNYYDIKDPSPKIVEVALDINQSICYSKTPHLNRESTTAAYLKIKHLIEKDNGSTTEIISKLSYYGHEVSDSIRIMAINTEKFDFVTVEKAFENISPFVNGTHDLNKLSEKVVDAALNKCYNYFIDIFTSDRTLVNSLITFYLNIHNAYHLNDPNEKHLDKMLDIIQNKTCATFDVKSEYKHIETLKDMNNFLDKFDN